MKIRFLILLFLIVIFTFEIYTQSILLGPSRLHYPVTSLPWVVETGDFNNDGNIDFVTASRLERSITLRLGNGNGTFNDSLNFPVGISPRTLIPADFNDDNNLDVAVANLLSNDVYILLGDGNGNFPNQNIYTVGDKPRSIITSYFDSDSILDLAITNRDANSISILLGNGDGTFTVAPNVGTSSDINPRKVRAGDLNNDMIVDLVVIHDEQNGSAVGQKYGVLLGNGDGSFQPISVYIISAGNGFPEAVSITLGTFNSDQNLDMVISLKNSAIDEIVSFSGNGDGTFNLVDIIPVGTAPFHIINNDLNKDGFSDIIVSNTSGGKITIHTNRGDGTFRNAIIGGSLWNYNNGAYSVGYAPRWVNLADINNDMILDILTANEEGNDVSVLIGDSDTTFVTTPSYDVGSPPQAFPSGSDAADFNNDGFIDLVVANWGYINTWDISVLMNSGDGTFEPKMNYFVGKNPNKVISKDFTGDNILDLAVLNSRDSLFSFLSGNGDGTFNPALNFSIKPDPNIILSMRDMASGDFNKDNLEDIVIVNYNEDYLALFFGNNQTVFDEVIKIPTGSSRPERLIVNDFNSDLNPDILLQQDAQFIGQPNEFYVYLGDGSGGFSSPVTTDWVGENTIFIVSEDFNNDNILDIAIIDEDYEIDLSYLILYQGNNDGSFTQLDSLKLLSPWCLYATDMVGDANIDLLVGSFASADIKIFEGNGNFSFTEKWPSYGLKDGVQYMTLADFDNDTDMDIVTTGGIFGESYASFLFNSSITSSSPNINELPLNNPKAFKLQQNYPNPFNPSTKIQYQVFKKSAIQLKIYNTLGQEISTLVNKNQNPKSYSIEFNAYDLASGVYYYTLKTNNQFETKKMILLR